MASRLRKMAIAASCLAALAAGGCFELNQSIELNADGSGLFVDEIRFDGRLIEASKTVPELKDLAALTDEKRARERGEMFGEVEFVKHEVEDKGSRGKVVRTTWSFKDISKLSVPAMPSRNANWAKQSIRFKIGEPKVDYNWVANSYVRYLPLTVSLSPGVKDTAAQKDPLTPAERQKLQEVLPAMRAMMEGFRFSITLKAFGPTDGQTRPHAIVDVRSEQLAEDDDLLLRVLLWNKYPDKYSAAMNHYAPHSSPNLGGGQVMNMDYVVKIGLAPTEAMGTPDQRTRK